MCVDVAPAPGERHLLVGRDLLVAEIDDAVIEQRPADLGEGRFVHLDHVDAANLGPAGAGNRQGLDWHGNVSCIESPAKSCTRSWCE